MSKRPPEPPQEVPAWIVSFSDMVTLLLAFFVLLQAFASAKSPELFHAGTGSFKRSVLNFGIPDMLIGKESDEKPDWKSIKYPVEEEKSKDVKHSIKDAEDEKIRELFNRIRKLSFEVKADDPGLKIRNTWPTAIKFKGRDTKISSRGKKELANLAKRLKTYVTNEKLTIYVVGYAPEFKGYSQQMSASGKRARAAEIYLRSLLAQQLHNKWRIRSLGTSENNRFSSRFSAEVKGQHIAIAVIAQ